MSKYEPLFAKYYDYLVHDRGEGLATDEDMAFLREAFFSRCAPVKDILDVGCGTGRYVVPFAGSGYRVSGIDSSPDMLAQCSDRLKQRGLAARLIELDMLDLREQACYDAVLCMNTVICYLLETEQIIRALSLFREALRPGGLLVLEIWNILANTASFGTSEVYDYSDGDVNIVNRQKVWYEPFPSIYHAELDVTVSDAGEDYSFVREEVLRVMTVGEVTAYLKEAGFHNIYAQSRRDTMEPESQDEEWVFLAVRP